MPVPLPPEMPRQPSMVTTTGNERAIARPSAAPVEPFRRFALPAQALPAQEGVPAREAAPAEVASVPVIGRSAAKASMAPRRPVVTETIDHGRTKTTNTVAVRPPFDAAPARPLSAADFGALPGPVPRASAPDAVVPWPEHSHSEVPTKLSAQSSSAQASNLPEQVQLAIGRTRRADPDPVRRTRLVAGLPALQNLLQAAVAESHQRHSPPPAATPSAEAPMPPVAQPISLVSAPPLRALTELDPVAEDMLVDRLCDRLQERLREQALRQFGFSGGLI